MAERRVPRIRFKGFEEDWEQRKLGDFCEMYNGDRGINYPKDSDMLKEGIPFVNAGDLQGGRVNLKDCNKITREKFNQLGGAKIQRGDILYCLRGTLGKNALVDNFDEGTVASSLVDIRSKNIDVMYLFTILNSDIEYRQRTLNDEGAAQPNLSARNLSEFDIPVSSSKEQEVIGTFFSDLGKVISLHQRKLEKLKILKKAMLEKMFPKNGEKVPEIRFSGFTDDWEQRKVGELLTERNDQAPMSDEYPLMAFIANEGVAPKGERYDRSALVNDTVGKLYKKTEFGDFIYSSNNLETGSIGLNKYGRASISPVYSIFHPTGLADSDFIGRQFVRKDFINAMVKWRQGVIYGQWRIHESDFIKIEVAVPSVKEQRKIGAFLDQLDTLITLHQRKLEKLHQIKKSMLERMFV